MCWINGFISNQQNQNLIEAMNTAIKHRWPDANGSITISNVTLGQVRLSILDLSDAWFQPMFYLEWFWACSQKHNPELLPKAFISIVFNWEIYNYLEIKKTLEDLWYKFNTWSDTEVILASYLEWGEKCVNQFNWMWAFCIHDQKANKLFLSRDRLWVKPLYYHLSQDAFIFSSELKWILTHEHLKLNSKSNINKDAIEYYLSLGYIPAPHTIFNNIYKLEARQNANLSLSTLELTKYYYYEIPEYKPIYDKDKLIEEWKALLKDAVKLRMRSDVPVWAFLSWWLDSSSVVAEMTNFTEKSKLHTFWIWFEGKYDETSYIDIVKKFLHTNHHHYYFKEEDFQVLIDKFTFHYDEPFWDYSGYPTYKVNELAKKDVTVVLSWDWWDEIFGGYAMHQVWAQMNLIYSLPKFVKKILYFLIPKTRNSLSLFSKAKEAFRISLLPKEEFYSNILSDNLYKSSVYKQFTSKCLKSLMNSNNWNFTQAIIDFDLFYNTLADNFLTKVDRASMAHAIEVRSPFLDYRFIEYCHRIPVKWKVNLTSTKIIMRDIIKDILPKSITYRWKKWFSPPIDKWILADKYIAFAKRSLTELFDNKIITANQRDFFQNSMNNIINQQHKVNVIKIFLLGKWYNKWVK